MVDDWLRITNTVEVSLHKHVGGQAIHRIIEIYIDMNEVSNSLNRTLTKIRLNNYNILWKFKIVLDG